MLGISTPIIAASLSSFVVTFFSIFWLIKGKVPGVLDYPNSRSLHSKPVPRTGGIGLMLSILTAWALNSVTLPISVWIGAGLLIIISFADDIFGLPVWSRLLVHGMVATGFSALLLFDTHGWVIVFIVAIATIWMSNLYNFMDGSDGLAGGMALIGFGCYGLVALLAGKNEFAIINFSIAAAALAFLYYNFYPARIFMGDVGAIPLGFFAAVLGVLGWKDGLWSWCLPLVIFSPFIADATVTLIMRGMRGEKIWLAHCEHFYQRIVRSGIGHRNTALSAYIVMLIASTSAVWAAQQNFATQYWVAIIWGNLYLIAMLFYGWCLRHQPDKG